MYVIRSSVFFQFGETQERYLRAYARVQVSQSIHVVYKSRDLYCPAKIRRNAMPMTAHPANTTSKIRVVNVIYRRTSLNFSLSPTSPTPSVELATKPPAIYYAPFRNRNLFYATRDTYPRLLCPETVVYHIPPLPPTVAFARFSLILREVSHSTAATNSGVCQVLLDS